MGSAHKLSRWCVCTVVLVVFVCFISQCQVSADSQSNEDLVFDNLDDRQHLLRKRAADSGYHNPKKLKSSHQEEPGWISESLHRIKRGLFDIFKTTESPENVEANEILHNDPPGEYDGDDDDLEYHHQQVTDDDEDFGDHSGSGDGEEKEKTVRFYRITLNVNEPFSYEFEDESSEAFSKLQHDITSSMEDIYHDLPGIHTASMVQAHPGEDQFHTKVTIDLRSDNYGNTNVLRERLHKRIAGFRKLGSTVVSEEGFTFSEFDARVPTQCLADEISCHSGGCVPANARCNRIKDCPDNSDETGCPTDCATGEFACDLTRCIEANRRCDGTTDCDDGTDERGCPVGQYCNYDQFRCNDGTCIAQSMRCDGIPGDCRNDEDEANCDDKTCHHYEWRCRDGTCIEQTLKCNMRNDCPDGSDEFNCTCKGDEFRCNNGTCLSISKRCDEVADCPFSEDEESCALCSPDEFKCSNGQCVDALMHCNGEQDCSDNSDEENCSVGPPIGGESCKDGKFLCDGGFCIEGYKRCNGIKDCPATGNDEENCPITTTAPPETPECPVFHIKCGDGSCVYGAVCDDVHDCPDGSDEQNCAGKCGPYEFQCDSGACIEDTLRCDSFEDCTDGSDEKNCVRSCPSGYFRCEDNLCITNERRCDRHEDCADGSDERDCPPTSTSNSCHKNQHSCDNGTICLDAIHVCDSFVDCNDTTDESNCKTGCESHEFSCNDRMCIDGSRKCDGIRDCSQGEDEENCGSCTDADFFQCADGACVALELRCDNFYDCRDFSDEQNCIGCRRDEFVCGDGSCIPERAYCDGRSDCRDGSDERDCPIHTTAPTDFRCPDGYRKCRTGSDCYPHDSHCNGLKDCYDGSDEESCYEPPRPTSPTTQPQLNLKTYPNAQDIKKGGEVVFQCRDEGPVRARVHWKRGNGLPLPHGSRDINGRLEMPNIQLEHSGTYICEAVGIGLGIPGSQVSVHLTVEPVVPLPTRPPLACQLHESTCSNGECISKNMVCDGKFDCSDGSDETRCGQGSCEPNEFRCANKQCILKTWVCDAEKDCFDGSDEANCEPTPPGAACSKQQFMCFSGDQCIPKSFHCDKQRDCQDGSDEIGCSAVTIMRPPPPMVELVVGELFEITCVAVGIPTPEIIWRLNWGHIPEKCRTRSVNGTGTLTCPDIQERDQGAYSCEAINTAGAIFAVPDTILIVKTTETAVCPKGFFNDDARRRDECISCFCFGVTNDCRSADLFTYQLNPPFDSFKVQGVHIDPQTGEIKVQRDSQYSNRIESRLNPTYSKMGVHIYHTPQSEDASLVPYFIMPEKYNGNQLKSYGGYLKYNLTYKGYGRPLHRAPDVILHGNGYTLIHNGRQHTEGATEHVGVRFFVGEWFRRSPQGHDTPASREEIMMALASVETILVKLQYVDGHLDTTIDDVEMDSAAARNTGLGDAVFVEECRCPLGYTGLSCENCAPGYTRHQSGPWLGKCYKVESCQPGEYGDPSRGIACQPCPCPSTSPSNQFGRTCSLSHDNEVTCDCLPGYTGRRCEQCAPGYSGNPLIPGDSCRPGVCNPEGAVSALTDEYGRCTCKQLTTGPTCNQCKANSFHLSIDNQFGCIDCFCMGVTQQCASSNWYRSSIQTSFTNSKYDFKIVDSKDKNSPSDTGIELHPETREITYGNFSSSPDVKYWWLPTRYLGNKITAYGGKLRYSLRYMPLPGGQSSRNTYPDVELISKSHIKLSYFHKSPIQPNSVQTISVPLLEQYWQRNDGQTADREHLLMALAEIDAILIKATYTTNSREVALQSVSLDIAEDRNTGLARAVEVEQCKCPEGYKGLSCETCAYGYRRTTEGLYLGLCERCNCNGYSSECDPETGVCINCRDYTTGPQCDRCAAGYTGDPANGIPCRFDRPETNCNCDDRGSTSPHCYGGHCQCKTNVEGITCNRCRKGTFGLSAALAEGCQSCFCSGVATECTESNLYIEQIPSQILDQDGNNGFRLTDQHMRKVIDSGFQPTIALNEIGFIFRPSETDRLFWSLPRMFTGNRIKSYGGKLEFTQRYTQRPNAKFISDFDIIINGNGIMITWSNPKQQQPDIANKISVVLSPMAGWQRLHDRQGPRPASREDILRVLAQVDSILIRAQPASDTSSSFISDITLDTAVDTYTGQDKAISVEECRCPPGYTGTSCEVCDRGYYRDTSDPSVGPLVSCQRCPCHNADDCQLDSNNQITCNCYPGYYGRDCTSTEPEGGSQIKNETVKPEIIVTIREPVLSIVSAGDNVKYYCEVQSPHAVHISWYKDGGQMSDRAIDDSRGTLIITDVRISDSGRYICHATDGVTVATQHVTLTVGGNDPREPRGSIQPEYLEINEGEPFELKCDASGIPLPNIHWDRVDRIPFNPQHTISDGSLYVSRAVHGDSGQYRCIATNIAGSHESYATVMVRQPTSNVPVIHPPYYSGPVGTPFTLVCDSQEPYNHLRWTKASGFLPVSARSNDRTLEFTDPRPEDSGTYTCTVTSYKGITTSKSAAVTITTSVVHGTSPTAIVRPNNQTVFQGQTVELFCESTGTPPTTVRWTRARDDFGSNTEQIGNTLRIQNVQVSDRGVYVCVVTNEHGIAQDSSILEVERREAPLIQIHPKPVQDVSVGGNAIIQCMVTAGEPRPLVTWSRSSGRPLGRHVEDLPGGVLRFSRIEEHDGGEYVCTARNDAGTVTATGTINVVSSPVISIYPPGNHAVVKDSRIHIECRATGIPQPSVYWQHLTDTRSESVFSTRPESVATLTIDRVTNQDEGTYVCIADNGVDTTQERIEISILPSRGDITDEDAGSDGNLQPKSNEIVPNVLDNVFTAYVSNDAELVCRFENSPFHITTKWVRSDGRQLPHRAHQTRHSLKIMDVQPSDAGEYQCLNYDQHGNIVFTQTARLQVRAVPRITLEPMRQNVRVYDDVTIYCKVTGDEPITIDWHAENREMPSSVRISGHMLQFQQIQLSDAGRYRCSARNHHGEADAVAEVLVQESEYRPPVEGRNQTATQGGSVTLSCVVSDARPYRSVEWYRDQQQLPVNHRRRGTELDIWDLQVTDAGEYHCAVRYDDGTSSDDYVNLHVASAYPRQGELTIHPSEVEPKLGDDLELHCRSNEPGVITTWSKVNSRLESNVETVSGTIRFQNLIPANSGTYRCEARGHAGYYHKDHQIHIPDTLIEPKPPMDIKTVPQSATIRLDCKVNLHGPIRYQWSRQGGQLPPYVDTHSRAIELRDVRSSDAGTYLCHAQDGRRNMTIPTVVVVTNIVPYFTQAPQSYLTLPTIPDHYTNFEFEISFKPENDYGLILYNGDRSGDYVSLSIVGGLIELKVNLGDNTVISVTSSDPVTIRQWHTVKVNRNRKEAVMYVDGKGPYTNAATGKFSGLNLRDNLFLGGVPDYNRLPTEIDVTSGFVGCISQFKVRSTHYDLLREAQNKTGVTNCETCQENPCRNEGVCQESLSKEGFTCICTEGYSGPKCQKMADQSCSPYVCGLGRCIDNEYSYECECPLGRVGRRCETEVEVEEPAFTRDAYIAYPALKPQRRLKISLKVKPRDLEDAVLLYGGETSEGYGDFVSLSIKDKHVEFRYDTGTGVTVIKSARPLEVDKWAVINALRTISEGRLYVNAALTHDKATGHHRPLSLNTHWFLGGVNKAEIVINSGVGVSEGFNGCISQFEIAGSNLNIISSAAGSHNVLDCKSENTVYPDETEYAHENIGCASNPCRNDGICYPRSSGDYTCHCVNGYSGNNCENAPNQCEQFRPCQNGGTCRGSTTDYECTCPVGYSGINCEQSQRIGQEAHFDGNGYLELNRTFLPPGHDQVIAMEFSTNHSNGLLLWHGQTPNEEGPEEDFVGLAVVDGYLEFTYNVGGGPFTIVNRQIRVDDGRTHTVILKRQGAKGSIDIDNLYLEKAESPAPYDRELRCLGNIYLGGTPNIPLMTGKYNLGFNGCIHGFEAQDSNRIELGANAVSGINVKPCSSWEDNFAN